jgi:serine/threonine protein kinase
MYVRVSIVVAFPYRLTQPDTVSTLGGTLRWQAPELMQGAEVLTQEMDVYAFAVCCREILTMGALPWPFMDDLTVRHSVLSGYPLPYRSAFSVNNENAFPPYWNR